MWSRVEAKGYAPAATEMSSAVVVGSNIFLTGGRSAMRIEGSIHQFNTVTSEWSWLGKAPARCAHACFLTPITMASVTSRRTSKSAGAGAADCSDQLPRAKLQAMKVRELKQILSERGQDFGGCIEKSDFIDMVLASNGEQKQTDDAPRATATADGDDGEGSASAADGVGRISLGDEKKDEESDPSRRSRRNSASPSSSRCLAFFGGTDGGAILSDLSCYVPNLSNHRRATRRQKVCPTCQAPFGWTKLNGSDVDDGSGVEIVKNEDDDEDNAAPSRFAHTLTPWDHVIPASAGASSDGAPEEGSGQYLMYGGLNSEGEFNDLFLLTLKPLNPKQK